MSNDFDSFDATLPASPAAPTVNPPAAADTGNDFQAYAVAAPSRMDDFAWAQAAQPSDDPNEQGFVMRMWAQRVGPGLLAAAQYDPELKTKLDTFATVHQNAQNAAHQAPLDPAGGLATYTKLAPNDTGMLHYMWNNMTGQGNEAFKADVTDIAAGMYGRSTADEPQRTRYDAMYRALYRQLVKEGKDPFALSPTGPEVSQQAKKLGLDPLTGEPAHATLSNNPVTRGVFEGSVGAAGHTLAFVEDAIQAAVDFVKHPTGPGKGIPVGPKGTWGQMADELRQGMRNIEQVNPASQQTQQDPYSWHGIGENLTQMATSMATQMALTGGFTNPAAATAQTSEVAGGTALASGERGLMGLLADKGRQVASAAATPQGASKLAFFGAMAGQTADHASQAIYQSLVQQGMDPQTANKEAVLGGAASAAVGTYLMAKVGVPGQQLGTNALQEVLTNAQQGAFRKGISRVAASVGTNVVAGRSADAVDQLTHYAITGDNVDVERFLGGAVGDVGLGVLFGTLHAVQEGTHDAAKRDAVAAEMAKQVFTSLGVPENQIEAAVGDAVMTAKKVKGAPDFNSLAKKYGAPVPDTVAPTPPAVKSKPVEAVVTNPADRPTAEPTGSAATAITAPETPSTTPDTVGEGRDHVATLDPAAPGVSRIRRPAGGWDTPSPAAPSAADVTPLQAEVTKLAATLQDQPAPAADKKAAVAATKDLHDSLQEAQQALQAPTPKEIVHDVPAPEKAAPQVDASREGEGQKIPAGQEGRPVGGEVLKASPAVGSKDHPSIKIETADLVPTRGPNGEVVWTYVPHETKASDETPPAGVAGQAPTAGKEAHRSPNSEDAGAGSKVGSAVPVAGGAQQLQPAGSQRAPAPPPPPKLGDIVNARGRTYSVEESGLVDLATGEEIPADEAAGMTLTPGRAPEPPAAVQEAQIIHDQEEPVPSIFEPTPAATLDAGGNHGSPQSSVAAEALPVGGEIVPAVRGENGRPLRKRGADDVAPPSAGEGADVSGGGGDGVVAQGGRRGAAEDAGSVPAGPGSQARAASGPERRGAGGLGLRPGEPGAPVAEPVNAGNFHFASPTDTKVEGRGVVGRARDNLAAIRLLREIEAQGRPATSEEQAVLAKFTGWGALGGVFTDWKRPQSLADIDAELKILLTEDEYDSAVRSHQNAYYTDGEIVAAMWAGLQRMGFNGGKLLEPGMGIGYFFSLMPALEKPSHLVGVELDTITGGLAKLLYPDAKIHVAGYQTVTLPSNYFDVQVGNVPFADLRIREDAAYSKMAPMIHDYYFLKALDQLRPGGIQMFITSKGTMDKTTEGETIRKAIAKKADLIAAFRLPGGAHEDQAATEVVTDIVILRKRAETEKPGGEAWLTTKPWALGDGAALDINEYYHAHPDHVLGTIDRSGSMYRGASMNVTPLANWKGKLQSLMASLPADAYQPKAVNKAAFEPQTIDDPGATKEGGLAVVDGQLFIKREGQLVAEKAPPAKIKRITGMLAIRDILRELYGHELAGRVEEAAATRAKLNKHYDSYVQKNGFLNDKENRTALAIDPDSPVVQSLEQAEGKKFVKADVFRKSTLRPQTRTENVAETAQALGVSLNETATVDLERIAALTGKSKAAISEELVAQELAFRDPGDGWVPGDVYLSGNVKKKLAEAQAAALLDPTFAPNVAALTKVQPADVPAVNIEARMGSAWITPADHVQFVVDLIHAQASEVQIFHNPETGGWGASVASWSQTFHGPEAQRYSTPRVGFATIMLAALNNKPHVVYDKLSDGTSVVNRDATAEADIARQNLQEAFKDWLWKDDARRERLARHYNDTFNTHRNIAYNGSHLTFPGMNPMITLTQWQRSGVWQQLMRGRGLMAWEVGSGKTFLQVAAAMEMKRLGMANKPTIAVPKDLIGQTTKEARALYPGARILSTDGRFEGGQRKLTVASIATGDWDMIIMTHEHLNYLSMKPEFIQEFISEQQEEIEQVIRSLQGQRGTDKKLLKQLAKAQDKVEQRWKSLIATAKKDNAVLFEETGIDHLFVDEAHNYKALPVYTQQQNVKGIPTRASMRAQLLFMKGRYLYGIKGGKGLTLSTGTPITNTMAEMYNFQRYLQHDEMKALGIHAFDAWASTFGRIQTKMEFTHKGINPVSSFSEFMNLPELRKLMGADMDVVRSPAGLNRPKMVIAPVEVPESETQRLYRYLTMYRVAMLPKRPGPGDDMTLLIIGDGKKASIDARLATPNAHDEPGSKLNRTVENVLATYRQQPDRLQFIFSDVGVWPTSWGFSAYEDIINKLVAGGIPRERIVDARSFTGSKGKRLRAEASAAADRGELAVILGSTKKVGTGLNAQKYCVQLHHLDAPGMPGDVEQRNGRGFRQGNLLYDEGKPLIVSPYITQQSADAFWWQLNARKSKFITAFMDGNVTERSHTDTDADTLSPDQIMALASGNPKLVEKIQVDEDLRRLARQRKFHQSSAFASRDLVKRLAEDIPQKEAQLAADTQAYEHLRAFVEAPPDVVINGKHVKDLAQIGTLLQALVAAYKENNTLRDAPDRRRLIGQWGDVEIYATQPYGGGKVDLQVRVHENREFATLTQDPEQQLKAIATAALRGSQPSSWREKQISTAKEQLRRAQASHETPFPKEQEYADLQQKNEVLTKELAGVKMPANAQEILAGLKDWEKELIQDMYAERMGRIGKGSDTEDPLAESGNEDDEEDTPSVATEDLASPTDLSAQEKRDALIAPELADEHKGAGPPGALQRRKIPAQGKTPAGGKLTQGLTLTVQGSLDAARKALAFFSDAGRNLRERFHKYSQDFGAAEGKPVMDALIGYLTAEQFGKSAGFDLADKTLEGLTQAQKENVIAMGLDGYRRAVNARFAAHMAKEITPAHVDEDDVAAAVFDTLNHMDAVNAVDLGPLMDQALLNVDRDVAIAWHAAMTHDIDFTPEAMADKELQQARELFKADDQTLASWQADAQVSAAMTFWQTRVAPWIQAVRSRRKLPDNAYFRQFQALNFVVDPDDDTRPRNIMPGVGQFNRFSYAGERKKFMGEPRDYLMKIVQGHMRTDKETDLYDLLEGIGVPEKDTTIQADNTRVADVLGKQDVPVMAFNVQPNMRKNEDIRFLPEMLVKDLRQIKSPLTPDSRAIIDTLGDFLIGLVVKGAAPVFYHMELSNAGRTMLRTNPHGTAVVAAMWRDALKTPYLAARDMVGKLNTSLPHAEAFQELLEALGAAGHRTMEPTSMLGRIWAFDDKILFDRVWGADNVIRRHMLENFLRVAHAAELERLIKAVDKGQVTPVEFATYLLNVLGDAGRVDAARHVNDTLGWTNKDIRSPWMNKIRVVWPYVGTHVASIPTAIGSLMSGNVDWAAVKRASQAKNWKLASKLVAAGMLTGAVGLFALSNLINYLINGHSMAGNDEGHKLDIQFGQSHVYFGLDPALHRAAKLLGLQSLANKGEFGSAAVLQDTAYQAWNVFWQTAHPAFNTLAKGLLGKSLQVDPEGDLYHSSRLSGLPTPYVESTAKALTEDRFPVLSGILRDLNSNLLGLPLRFDDRAPDQRRRAAYDLAVARATQILQEPATHERDAQLNTFLTHVAADKVEGKEPLDAKAVMLDALTDAKRPLVQAVATAIRRHDQAGYDKAMAALQASGYPVHQLTKTLVERKFLDPQELQAFLGRKAGE